MQDSNEIKKLINEKGYTLASFSKKLGINVSTLFRKLNKCNSFTIGEAVKMCSLLNLTKEQAVNIFFKEKVA